ncbi:MAG: MFS transporter [Anaerolineae bacterium]|jgi:MFS family permease|nr:MFS transporter [Anaerolineae bacterium]
MKRLRWYDYITINIYWLGINIATGAITPIILPYLVALFVPAEVKNTYLSIVRVAGLAVAMLVQPLAGMLSDRSTLLWGRRRPYIVVGTLFNVIFLAIIGWATNYWMVLVGIVLLQFSSNVSHGALQGLIPDLVPDDQRGRASGVKAIMELLPAILMAFTIGPLIDQGQVALSIVLVMISFVVAMLITVLGVKEEPLREKPTTPVSPLAIRLFALTGIFLVVTYGLGALVALAGRLLAATGMVQLAVVALAGLVAMSGSIFLGVYYGARVGVGPDAQKYPSFIWWVVNRLMFLAAVGSIQGFAQYFLADVLHIPNAAAVTTVLLAVVGVFLLLSALPSGYLADRFGRRQLVGWSGIVAAVGTFLLLFSAVIPTIILADLGFLVLTSNVLAVIVSGCIIGIAAGVFMTTNWALGTDLVPPEEAGRYLGISNLAGAGAGIVGAGIGGPMADFFNAYQPGLGYLVIFAIYGALFLLSTLTLAKVPEARRIR